MFILAPSISYAHTMWKRDPGKVRTPLPVSVFNWRVSGGSYGFLSDEDRKTAKRELTTRYPEHVSDRSIPHLTFTTYKDKHAPYAAQVIVWVGGSKVTGYRFSGRGHLVLSATNQTPVVQPTPQSAARR